MRQLYSTVFTSALLLLLLSACKSDYTKMVEREHARGIRVDSIFLGVRFGMADSAFYAYCWEMNKKGVFFHGNENEEISVLNYIRDFKNPIHLYFFPDFHDRKIYRMRALFRYEAWAPWNRELASDVLIHDILQLAERWYGKGFLALKTPQGAPFWVKVEGNRQVLITLPNERHVRWEITDLDVPVPEDQQAPQQKTYPPFNLKPDSQSAR